MSIEATWIKTLRDIQTTVAQAAADIRAAASDNRDTQKASLTERQVGCATALEALSRMCESAIKDPQKVPHVEVTLRPVNPLWISPIERVKTTEAAA